MTNTGTARQQVTDTAEANGWTLAQDTVTGSLFDRGTDTVTVGYTRAGAVQWGTRNGVAAGYRGKRETVIGWLTEAPTADEGVTMTHTEQDPFGPLDREGSPMGQVQRPDGWVDPMDTDDEDPAPAPAPDYSDRDVIYDAHLRRGWAMFATTDRHYGFRRDEIMVSISFTEDGAIIDASRRTDGTRTPENTRQLYVVIGWLAETPCDCTRCMADLHANALDENADRDRALVEDLDRTVGEVKAVRDARIAELERQAAVVWAEVQADRARTSDRIAELEAQATGHGLTLDARAAGLRIARNRIAELERQAANKDQAYREVRERVTELEDERGSMRGQLLDENADRDRARLNILQNTRRAENDALQAIGELAGFAPGRQLTDLPEHVREQLAQHRETIAELRAGLANERHRAEHLRQVTETMREAYREGQARITELEQTAQVMWTEVQADRQRAAARVGELEAQAANKDQAYREVRERITELEDQAGPMRRQLLDALGELDRPPLAQLADAGDRGRKGDALRAILSRHLP